MATILQARSRSFLAIKQYSIIHSKILVIQCWARQRMACQVLNQLKVQRHILHMKMATRITTLWRRHYCQSIYQTTVHKIIHCQSTIRRFAAIQELHQLQFQRDTLAATTLQSAIRSHLARSHFHQVKSKTIFLQSLYRQWIAYNELEDLKEERRLLEKRSATMITAVWRSYCVRTGYIIVLKGVLIIIIIVVECIAIAIMPCLTHGTFLWNFPFTPAARRHEERYNAASILQAEWRRRIGRRNYLTLRSNTIRLQSILRMGLATTGLKSKKVKIEQAANYHKDDYFAYSKKRKGAAIKIQAVYRMYPVRRDYLWQKSEWEKLEASSKIQSVYRNRYSTRMSRATNKTEMHSSKPIFNDDCLDDCDNVEIELGKKPSTHNVNDFFVSAKKRRSAAISIQASFRGHLARESAKKTAYLAKNAFELSKQRRVAADKIQNAYRTHLFRSTCKFTPLPSFDEQSCTDIVTYVEKPSDFQLVVAGTDLLGLIMSMITG